MATKSYRINPSRQFYPDNDYRRPPSPQRFNNKPSKKPFSRTIHPSQYGHKKTRFSDYETGRGYTGIQSLSKRRGCVAALVCLAVALLIGLAIGLYFAITSVQNSATASATSTTNLLKSKGYSGYYVDGVYVVPVTNRPVKQYLVLGTDFPCNPYNNNSKITPNPNEPNCNVVTTKMVPSNFPTSKNPNAEPPEVIFLASDKIQSVTLIGLILLTATQLFAPM